MGDVTDDEIQQRVRAIVRSHAESVAYAAPEMVALHMQTLGERVFDLALEVRASAEDEAHGVPRVRTDGEG